MRAARRASCGNVLVRWMRPAPVQGGSKVRKRHGMAKLLRAARGLNRDNRRSQSFHDPDRGALQPLRRTPGTRVRGRSSAYGIALLHQWRGVELRARGAFVIANPESRITRVARSAAARILSMSVGVRTRFGVQPIRSPSADTRWPPDLVRHVTGTSHPRSHRRHHVSRAPNRDLVRAFATRRPVVRRAECGPIGIPW